MQDVSGQGEKQGIIAPRPGSNIMSPLAKIDRTHNGRKRMPTLKELSDPQVREHEARLIASMSKKYEERKVALNHGFRNDSELIKRIEEGYNIQFDYNRLLEEAEKYD